MINWECGHAFSTHLFNPDKAPEVPTGAWCAGASGCLAWGAWAWALCFAPASLAFHADLIDSARASTLSSAYLCNTRGQTYSIYIHSISNTDQNLLHYRFMIRIGFIVSEPHNLPGFSITIPIEFYDSIIVLFSCLLDTKLSVLSHSWLFGLTLPTPHPTYPYYQRTRMRSWNWQNLLARCITGKPV